eukprot:scaffold203640_cov32-Tisochrysis_lutea.AAC.1
MPVAPAGSCALPPRHLPQPPLQRDRSSSSPSSRCLLVGERIARAKTERDGDGNEAFRLPRCFCVGSGRPAS